MSTRGSTAGRIVVGSIFGFLVTMPLWISADVPGELRRAALILGLVIGPLVYCLNRPKIGGNSVVVYHVGHYGTPVPTPVVPNGTTTVVPNGTTTI
jgi:hypothetical protein